MQDDKKAFEQYKGQSMTWVGKIIYHTRASHYYRDGTFFSGVLKWWHPVSWILFVVLILMALPLCLFTEMTLKEYWKEGIVESLSVSKFFKDNPDKLRWYNPYKEELK